ncbi:MAG: GNAT family acetyltransferase [Hyphomicrobiales bacterium]|nr:GNAT family acetyltransferase [Hyphomicrobiales bacterium]
MLDTAPITDADIDAVVALWRRAGLTRAWNDPYKDIDFARAAENATVLVGRAGAEIVASVMVGHDGHRGAVYYLAVDPGQQGRGFGRAIMNTAEDWLKARGVWKLNLLVRGDNLAARGFYEALGYTQEPNIQMGRRFAD